MDQAIPTRLAQHGLAWHLPTRLQKRVKVGHLRFMLYSRHMHRIRISRLSTLHHQQHDLLQDRLKNALALIKLDDRAKATSFGQVLAQILKVKARIAWKLAQHSP